VSEQPSERVQRTTRVHLERPWNRRRLIHELARGEVKQSDLAVRYDVSRVAITDFKARHADAIEQVRADLENEFAGLWIADKTNRLMALQDDIEHIATRLTSTDLEDALADYVRDDDIDSDERKRRAERVADALAADPAWMRLRHQALRAAADELGQIPNKTTVAIEQPITVRHVLEGVDVDGL
jgi:hypothetical protein